MSRGDWHEGSDIDVFILGSDDTFEQAVYERKLKREIQVFTVKNDAGLAKYKNALLLNILKGDIIKGDVDFLEVQHAAKS